jgi:hypothetical protein
MKKPWDLRERTMDFAVGVYKLCRTLPKTDETRDVALYFEVQRSKFSVSQLVSVASLSLAGAILSSTNVFHSWQ